MDLFSSYLERKRVESKLLAVEVGKMLAGGGKNMELSRSGKPYRRVSTEEGLSRMGFGDI